MENSALISAMELIVGKNETMSGKHLLIGLQTKFRYDVDSLLNEYADQPASVLLEKARKGELSISPRPQSQESPDARLMRQILSVLGPDDPDTTDVLPILTRVEDLYKLDLSAEKKALKNVEGARVLDLLRILARRLRKQQKRESATAGTQEVLPEQESMDVPSDDVPSLDKKKREGSGGK